MKEGLNTSLQYISNIKCCESNFLLDLTHFFEVGEMNRRLVLVVSLAVTMVLFNLGAAFLFPGADTSVVTLGVGLAAGIVSAGISLLFGERSEVVSDKRTKKIHNEAMAYSWWIVFIFIAVYFWLDYFGKTKQTAPELASTIFILMTVTYILFWFVRERKGFS